MPLLRNDSNDKEEEEINNMVICCSSSPSTIGETTDVVGKGNTTSMGEESLLVKNANECKKQVTPTTTYESAIIANEIEEVMAVEEVDGVNLSGTTSNNETQNNTATGSTIDDNVDVTDTGRSSKNESSLYPAEDASDNGDTTKGNNVITKSNTSDGTTGN
jgi:hypothetical protein